MQSPQDKDIFEGRNNFLYLHSLVENNPCVELRKQPFQRNFFSVTVNSRCTIEDHCKMSIAVPRNPRHGSASPGLHSE